MSKKVTPEFHQRESACASHGQFLERGFTFLATDRIKWAGCPACNQEARERDEAAAHARREQERQIRIERKLDAGGIPKALRDRTFDAYEVESDKMALAFDTVKEFADNFWSRHTKLGTMLVLAGTHGTGKAHLSIAACQVVLQRGTAMYTTVTGMIRMIRNTWRRDSEVSEMDIYRTLGNDLDLLVVDEIGLQRCSEDEQITLFEVLDMRYRELRPTILITNLGGTDLAECVGPRIFDRLRERGIVVPMNWESHRGRA